MRFTQGLERAVQQHPMRVATICGSRSQTFAELKERVARLAGGLQSLGLSRPHRIAILSYNSDRYLEAYLAISWLGATVVPVNVRWSMAEIAYSLNDAKCRAIMIGQQYTGHVDELCASCPDIQHVIYMDAPAAGDGRVNFEALIESSAPAANADAGGGDLLGIFLHRRHDRQIEGRDALAW